MLLRYICRHQRALDADYFAMPRYAIVIDEGQLLLDMMLRLLPRHAYAATRRHYFLDVGCASRHDADTLFFHADA